MKVIEFKNVLSLLDDDMDICFYVHDCEYDEQGYDMGRAVFKSIDSKGYVDLRVNYSRWED